MKKNILLVFAASAMLMGAMSSCTKENDQTPGEKGTGSLSVQIAWAAQEESKAAKSTDVIPITTWANNVGDMSLILVNGGVIKDVRTVTPETATNNNAITRTWANIEVGTNYDVYIIANYNETTTPFGAGSVTPSAAIGTSLKGSSMNNLLMNLVTVAAASTVGTDPVATTAYGEPSEIFIGKLSGVAITDGQTTDLTTTPMQLKRAVSLLRVRINQAYNPVANPGSVDNSGVDFRSTGNVATRLRYHGTGINVAGAAGATAAPYGITGITTTAASINNTFYSNKTYKNQSEFDAVKGTQYGTGADMGLSASDFTLWNEYLILPGGHASSSDIKFNLALTGYAPAGYKGVDSAGNAVQLSSPQIVTWAGQVTGEVKPNCIIELNVQLLNPGIVGPDIPVPSKYGNLKININLLDWDTNVIDVPMPL